MVRLAERVPNVPIASIRDASFDCHITFPTCGKVIIPVASKALLKLFEIVRITSATYMMADQIRSYPLRHGLTWAMSNICF